LNETNGNTTTGTGNTDANPDEEFVKRLNSVKEQLFILLSKAEDTSVNDKELMRRLDAVNRTLSTIEAKLKNAEAKTADAEQNSRNASGEIDLAESSIGRSWDLVKQIRGPANETAIIINRIYKILANWTKTTIRISETVREVTRSLVIYPPSVMDHLHYRLNFDLDKNFITA
jgi:hypothetical protein